jgi:hypothetical protein
VAANCRSFLTARLKISGYSSVKPVQKLERAMVEILALKTDPLAIFINSSHSLIEKSYTWNEPIKICQQIIIIIIIW